MQVVVVVVGAGAWGASVPDVVGASVACVLPVVVVTAAVVVVVVWAAVVEVVRWFAEARR